MRLLPPFYGAAGVAFLLDQGSKWWVREHFALHETHPILPGVFHLTYVHNRGAAFGFLAHSPWSNWLFVALALAAIGLILRHRRAILRHPPLFQGGVGLFLGGALGNLVDRLRWQYVVDFLDLRIWPVFNVADMAVSIGTALILFHLWRTERSAPSRAGRNRKV